MLEMESRGGSPPPLVADTLMDTRPLTRPEPEPSTEPPAPAEMVPVPKRWERLAWYGGAMLLSCLLILSGLRLDRADLKAPFYYDLDSLLIMSLVKATHERGFGGHWRNERMGAPGIQELHDFPVIDHLHFFLIWLLGKFVANVALLYNLYFLLTFPLTTLTAMIAFRQLRLTLPAAAVGGLLYSFLPYHYQRWENHYFLAAYWLVPLAFLPVLAICKGDFPFFQKQLDGSYRRHLVSWRSLGLVILGAAVASGGAYYAFFTCAILAMAGCYGWAVFRTWRAAAAAGGLIAIIFVVGLANHTPTIIYEAKYGRNPVTDRDPEEADMYGLKISHLVLPINEHRLPPLNQLKVMYLSGYRPSENENQSASLGIIGTAGLIGLVVLLLLPGRRPWPYGPLATLSVLIVLLGTIGGFGAVFNLIVTAQIRAYNRISVFLAFLCLFAALWALDRFLLTRTDPRLRRLRYPAWAAVLLLGFLDQTPSPWFTGRIVKTLGDQAERFRMDDRFFSQIEEAMPPGSQIFCLPYAAFPERPAIYKMGTYEHSRGYLHTNTLRWSFGAMKGREVDAWQIDVAYPLTTPDKVRQMLKRLIGAGFDGVFIDSRGFPPEGQVTAAVVIDQINRAYAAELNRPVAHLPEIRHESGNQFFLDLRPYRDAYRARHPDAYKNQVQDEHDWVAVIWLDGFHSPEPIGFSDQLRYGSRDGKMWMINPSDHDQHFRLSMSFGADVSGTYHFKLSGLIDDEFDLVKNPGDRDVRKFGERKGPYPVTVPPGRHFLRIQCTPPPDFIPNDHRNLCYYIMDFKKS